MVREEAQKKLKNKKEDKDKTPISSHMGCGKKLIAKKKNGKSRGPRARRALI